MYRYVRERASTTLSVGSSVSAKCESKCIWLQLLGQLLASLETCQTNSWITAVMKVMLCRFRTFGRSPGNKRLCNSRPLWLCRTGTCSGNRDTNCKKLGDDHRTTGPRGTGKWLYHCIHAEHVKSYPRGVHFKNKKCREITKGKLRVPQWLRVIVQNWKPKSSGIFPGAVGSRTD